MGVEKEFQLLVERLLVPGMIIADIVRWCAIIAIGE